MDMNTLTYFMCIIQFIVIIATSTLRTLEEEYGKRAEKMDAFFQCTKMLIKNRDLEDFDIAMKLYSTNSSIPNMFTPAIVRAIFHPRHPVSIYFSSFDVVHKENVIVKERMCMTVVANFYELKLALKTFYQKVHHNYCYIFVTFAKLNMADYLSRITKSIWTQGLARNVLFFAYSYKHSLVNVLGAPPYSHDTCLFGKIMKIGHCQNGQYVRYVPSFHHKIQNLHGCELNILVQPPYLPYIERPTADPRGVVGFFMEEVSRSLNVSIKYSWSLTKEGALAHLGKDNFHLFVDLFPRAQMSFRSKFECLMGVVTLVYVLPKETVSSSWSWLAKPFKNGTWVATGVVILSLLILCIFTSRTEKADGTKMVLKALGILLGVGVGRMPNNGWMSIIMWTWLLPSFILEQSYLAALTRQLTVPSMVMNLDTLDKLGKSDLTIPCSVGSKVTFCKSEDFSSLCENCQTTPDEELYGSLYPSILKTGKLNNTAVLLNMEIIRSSPLIRYASLHPQKTEVHQIMRGFPGSMIIFEVNNVWNRLYESGIIPYWTRLYATQQAVQLQTVNDVTREKLWGCFAVLITGWIISFVVLVVEMLYHHFHGGSRNRVQKLII